MLFDTETPDSNGYGNMFTYPKFNKAASDLSKFDKAAEGGYKYGKPIGDAAINVLAGFLGPFGGLVKLAYGGGSMGVDALVRGRRKQLAKRVGDISEMANDPGFDYGFDENGQFFQRAVKAPAVDLSEPSYIREPNPSSLVSSFSFGSNMPNFGKPATSDTNEGALAVDENANFQMDNMAGLGENGSDELAMGGGEEWGNPGDSFVAGYKHGGVMVTGGQHGKDDIALVNVNTGEDTGKRVTSGEMVVFSKETLHELKEAMGEKDKGTVFRLVKNQIEKTPNEEGGMADGGMTNTKSQNAAFWTSSALGDVYDYFRLAQGLQGANEKIPTWQKPLDWQEYMNKMKFRSDEGFTAAERALYQTNMDRQYQANVDNILNLSQGNNGIALANLGRENMNQYMANLNLAAADASKERENLAAYGSVLGNDVNLDRLIFSDKYNEAKQVEAAGAKTANDAIQNIKERSIDNRFYNPSSAHGRLMEAETQQAETTAAEQEAFLKFLRENPDALLKFSVGSSAGALDAPATPNLGTLYDDYVKAGGKLPYSDFIKTRQ